ncbi:MAG TPA: hypothetical protein ENO30_04725, partial [Thermodesulfobium narugense]|nr:hypothetical protein [Thermodesulfobium narugense]
MTVKVSLNHSIEIATRNMDNKEVFGIIGKVEIKSTSHTALIEAVNELYKKIAMSSSLRSFHKIDKTYLFKINFETWLFTSRKNAEEKVKYIENVIKKITRKNYKNNDENYLRKKILKELIYNMFVLIQSNKDYNLFNLEVKEFNNTITLTIETNQDDLLNTFELIAEIGNALEYNIS